MHMSRLLVAVIALLVSAPAFAHLCNDVFMQAKDNLAVKVDIRDGQLRIGQEASFRVYLLNTMDRDIANIALEVESAQFTATVTPSPDWRTHPVLKAVRSGGKKEYFTVTLQRKPGVPDARYQIQLRLREVGGRARTFKAVDLDAATGLCDLPKNTAIKVDGQAGETEWARSYLCTGFYAYVQGGGPRGGFFENRPAQEQTRVRLAADANHLYCLVNFQGGDKAAGDKVTLYVAPTAETKPVAVTFDRTSGQVSCERGTQGIEAKVSPDKNLLECKIPRQLLGIQDVQTFYANVTRTIDAGQQQNVTYWRGNRFSITDPIVYAQFRLAE